jgi:hypothetical protein
VDEVFYPRSVRSSHASMETEGVRLGVIAGSVVDPLLLADAVPSNCVFIMSDFLLLFKAPTPFACWCAGGSNGDDVDVAAPDGDDEASATPLDCSPLPPNPMILIPLDCAAACRVVSFRDRSRLGVPSRTLPLSSDGCCLDGVVGSIPAYPRGGELDSNVVDGDTEV